MLFEYFQPLRNMDDSRSQTMSSPGLGGGSQVWVGCILPSRIESVTVAVGWIKDVMKIAENSSNSSNVSISVVRTLLVIAIDNLTSYYTQITNLYSSRHKE